MLVPLVFECNGVIYYGTLDEKVNAVTDAPAIHVSDGNQWWRTGWLQAIGSD